MKNNKRQRNFLLFNGVLLVCMAILMVLCYRHNWPGIYEQPPKPTESRQEESSDLPQEPSEDSNEYEGWPELQVHFIDVGQADCTLLELDGHFMLIDAGDEEDVEKICHYLDSQGAYELDYIIATHPHADHIGSMDAVIRQYDVEQMLVSGVQGTTPSYSEMVQAMRDKKLEGIVPQVGEVYVFGNALFQILGPSVYDPENWNNDSIAIKLTYGETSFIFAGDAEREEELDICGSGVDISADVMKVNHHGSSSSTSEIYMMMVEPEYAVITCGVGNEYGHPTMQTMRRLRKYGVSIYRTDTQGDIIATSDGGEITWNMEPSN